MGPGGRLRELPRLSKLEVQVELSPRHSQQPRRQLGPQVVRAVHQFVAREANGYNAEGFSRQRIFISMNRHEESSLPGIISVPSLSISRHATGSSGCESCKGPYDPQNAGRPYSLSSCSDRDTDDCPEPHMAWSYSEGWPRRAEALSRASRLAPRAGRSASAPRRLGKLGARPQPVAEPARPADTDCGPALQRPRHWPGVDLPTLPSR